MDWFRKKNDEDSLELRKSQAANAKVKLTDMLYNGGKLQPDQTVFSSEGEKKAGEFSAELNRQLKEKEERILRNKRIRSREEPLKENVNARPGLELEKVELQELRRRVSKLEGLLEDERLRRGLLERKLGEERRELEMQRDELERRKQDLSANENEQGSRIERLQRRYEEIIQESESWKIEKKRLEAKLDAKNREYRQLEQKLGDQRLLQRKTEKLESVIERQDTEIRKLKNMLRAKEEECEDLLVKNRQLKRKVQNLENSVPSARKPEPAIESTLDTELLHMLSLSEIIRDAGKQRQSSDVKEADYDLLESPSLWAQSPSTTTLFRSKPAENTDYLLNL
ncbi:hypothetical protein KL925_001608 [Ogataea polymorpha]|uniref:Uncharacterized protein n=1 Tax=Ogataea polymorpha TaxID=460523 RepID=A0A1B7SIU3_9ASCO|nr:uncharacterized protein OGAPODRAFT_93401 [Ogataea polymorpha]KAG7882251.1 hypothetical protein KL937_000822 [Ogataea polymorpha]KAG7891664.1 hypothetical protein KL936_001607 [Ogataea polymorpha]KAG7895017.1 hypothetical protein KL908_001367 [Ogataea polymorpha]KAG7902500.1 hypothetical protein KL935_001408 [Ogataea polymorpha]KAG7911512.1 hypothetical protein KL906_000833 [Ogataea polymorpha]